MKPGCLLVKTQLCSQKMKKKSRIFKRSIYVSKDIKKNEKFTNDNIKIIRPGYGLKTKYYKKVLKSKASVNLTKGTRLKLSHIKNNYETNIKKIVSNL